MVVVPMTMMMIMWMMMIMMVSSHESVVQNSTCISVFVIQINETSANFIDTDW
jgi:hypothetical protein